MASNSTTTSVGNGGNSVPAVRGDNFGSIELTIVISVSVAFICIALIVMIFARQYVRRREREKQEKRQREAQDDVESNRSFSFRPGSASRPENPPESAWQDVPNCFVPETCGTLQKHSKQHDESVHNVQVRSPKKVTLPREKKPREGHKSKATRTPSPSKASPHKERTRRLRAGSATPTSGTRQDLNDVERAPWQDLPNCYVPQSCTLPRQQRTNASAETSADRLAVPDKLTLRKEQPRSRSTTPTQGGRRDLSGCGSPDSVFREVTPLALVLSASDSGHGSVPGTPVDENDLNEVIQYRPTSTWTSLDRQQTPADGSVQPQRRRRLQTVSGTQEALPDKLPKRSRAYSTSALLANANSGHRRDVDIDELLTELDIQQKQSNRQSQYQVVDSTQHTRKLGVVPPVVTVQGWPQPQDEPVYSYSKLRGDSNIMPVRSSLYGQHRIDADVDLPFPSPPSNPHFYDLAERQHLDV